MDLQAKLTSLLKEKEEQEQIKNKAEDNIRLLNLMIKPLQRAIDNKIALGAWKENTESEVKP